MIVYHGTDSASAENILLGGIDLSYGDVSVDNGQGFYMTPNLKFAAQRAKIMTARKKAFQRDADVTPAVLEIELDLNADSALKIKKFGDCSYEWKEFVFYNRIGRKFMKKWNIESGNHNLDGKYDVVMDETADAGVNDLVSDCRYKKNIDPVPAIIRKIGRSDNPDWDRQISLHSRRAVDQCVKSIRLLDFAEV